MGMGAACRIMGNGLSLALLLLGLKGRAEKLGQRSATMSDDHRVSDRWLFVPESDCKDLTVFLLRTIGF